MARRSSTMQSARLQAVPDTVQDLPALLKSGHSELSAPRYTIVGSIHRGGMGEILLGRVEGAEGFSRKVVLKGLLDRLARDDVSYQLFMREARLMACLEHPNIVRVFDLPVLGGKPYLAMEYVRGRNLHQVIQRAGTVTQGVPLRIALTVVAEALRGLHYAHSLRDADGHSMGLIHRDVSPGNVLMSFFGEVKVTDFGIAKLADSPRFTGPRSIRGKARYVAPEQVHGHAATILSDVYSAGVVLAEALLGEPLWERRTVPETLLAIVSENREATLDRILARQPNLPGLRAALRGALALNPSDRFASALQFAETLESLAAKMGGMASHVELGIYLRDLFQDAADVPHGDGFGSSGFPVPKFEIGSEESETESTIVYLEREWMRPAVSTARMRPEPPPAPSSTPLIAAISPVEPMLEAELGPTLVSQAQAPQPFHAEALPDSAAVLADPAEPPRPFDFAELAIISRTIEEDSAELNPARSARRRGWSGLSSERGMALLLAGIFIGASLALLGCIIALLVGH